MADSGMPGEQLTSRVLPTADALPTAGELGTPGAMSTPGEPGKPGEPDPPVVATEGPVSALPEPQPDVTSDGGRDAGPEPDPTTDPATEPGGEDFAPGVTATEIKVGMAYFANTDEANRNLGVNVTRGDERANWQAVVDEVNARGGIAGRQVVPVYHAYDAQSTQPFATQDEAACSAFTQDTRVFAVVTSGFTETFTACLHQAGVLNSIPGSYVFHDREFLRRYPAFFTQRPSQDRMQAELVSSFSRQAYFTPWDTARGEPAAAGKAKVGVLVIDEPEITRPMDKVLLPALTGAGHPVDPDSIYRVQRVPSPAYAGQGAAEMQGAVLRFRQEGVTHVIVLDVNGATTFLFAQQSSNQGYFPRLGISSASGIQQLYDAGLLEARQVNGATGLGWTPGLDLPPGDAEKFLSKAAPECLEVITRRTGQAPASTTAKGVAMIQCDAVFTLATVLDRTEGDLTLSSAVRSIESIGSALEAATVPQLFFSATRHDGLETAFDMAWDADCSCMRYQDSGHKMP